jgi:glycosyltransferase involved in cell wall biosynthesis
MGFTQRIEVVSNSCNPVFLESGGHYAPVLNASKLELLFVARAYPHKNHEFLPKLALEARVRHHLDLRFLVTLRSQEWGDMSDSLKSVSRNLGELQVADLPEVYRQSQAVIFPSLLECFSATPLEAMAMGKTLFASDRDFSRAICGEAATYFDPEDPELAASQISDALKDEAGIERKRIAGLKSMKSAETNEDRTRRYLELINSALVKR